MLIPPMLWDRPEFKAGHGEKVVLLHGLWRGFHAMSPLARKLKEAGFSTLNIPYPSSRQPIDRLVRHIRGQIERYAGDETVHFVTHSLGGIIARSMLCESLPWRTGRLVMLAPPNQGSEIVNWASHHKLVGLLGPAGKCLGSEGLPSTLPPLPPGLQAAVIMGRRSTIPLFRRLLEDENDGIVSVEKGRIEGLSGFSVVDADHTFIQSHPETVKRCITFLKCGEWPD
jgi:pimeloyl-ACP methyl ester carboxylesterase